MKAGLTALPSCDKVFDPHAAPMCAGLSCPFAVNAVTANRSHYRPPPSFAVNLSQRTVTRASALTVQVKSVRA